MSKEPSHPKKCFLDIVQNIESIISYIGDRDYDSFVKDRRTVDAVERCLQRITEAAIKLTSARSGRALA